MSIMSPKPTESVLANIWTGTTKAAYHSMNTSAEYLNNTLISKCAKQDTNFKKFILEVTHQILVIYPLTFIIIGTVTNSLSIAVLTRPKMRKSSTFFYLLCLSGIDMFILYTFCINFVFYYQFGVDVQLKHVIFCKLYSFLIYFLPQFSGWTCAAVSLDRVV